MSKFNSIPAQFHLPARSLRAPDTNIEFSDNIRVENRTSFEAAESRQTLRGFLDKLEENEGFKKVVSRLNKMGVPVERVLREIFHDSRGKPSVSEVLEKLKGKVMKSSGAAGDYGATRVGRDVNGDFQFQTSEGEGVFEDRLERFKVKTVNIPGVGVVKEDKNSHVLREIY